jgi:TPR repeat protein
MITYGPDDTVVALDPLLVKARQRYLRAACGGATAQYMAGYHYEYGLGVSRSLVKAYVWYSISAANGRTEAKTQRDRMAVKMTSKQLTAAQDLVKTWNPPNCAEWRGGKP